MASADSGSPGGTSTDGEGASAVPVSTSANRNSGISETPGELRHFLLKLEDLMHKIVYPYEMFLFDLLHNLRKIVFQI